MVRISRMGGFVSLHARQETQFERALEHFSGKSEELAETFATFMEFLPQLLSAIEHGLKTENLVATGIAVHSLRGALSHFFPRFLTEELRQLELATGKEKVTSAEIFLQWSKIEPRLQSFCEEMQTKLSPEDP